MNAEKNQQTPAPQEKSNSTVKQASNAFDNNRSAEQDVQQAKDELEKEQQFKEAQTERD